VNVVPNKKSLFIKKTSSIGLAILAQFSQE